MSVSFTDSGNQAPPPALALSPGYQAPPSALAPSPGYQAPPPASAPSPGYQVPVTSAPAPAPGPVVGIVRDDRANPEEGKYSFDFETEDGIVRSESGSPTGVGENPTGQQGSFKYEF